MTGIDDHVTILYSSLYRAIKDSFDDEGISPLKDVEQFQLADQQSSVTVNTKEPETNNSCCSRS